MIRPNAIIHNLLPGSYDIKLEIEGYEEIEKQIVIEDNKIERIEKSEWEEKNDRRQSQTSKSCRRIFSLF